MSSDRAAGASQQMARVNVSEEEWLAFRVLVLENRQTIADRLGELVRRELEGGSSPAEDADAVDADDTRSEDPRPHEERPQPRVRLSEVELLSWPPTGPHRGGRGGGFR